MLAMAELESWARNLVRTWGGRGSSSLAVTRFATAPGWRGWEGHSLPSTYVKYLPTAMYLSGHQAQWQLQWLYCYRCKHATSPSQPAIQS